MIRALPDDQREAIHQSFRENLSYAQIAARARERLGLRLSGAMLCGYYYSNHAEIFGRMSAAPPDAFV